VLAQCGGDGGVPGAGDVFPDELGDGLSYVPMPDADRVSFESTFTRATGAADVAVRTVAVEGSTSVGLRVASMVMSVTIDEAERERLFADLGRRIPLVDPRREDLDGIEAWVHANDEALASSIAVVDGRRLVVVYGGVLAAERLVVKALDM
jgi:hypothetical protein